MQEIKSRFSTEKKVKAIPEGFHTITPYLFVRGADEAIEFYKKAFGARERRRTMAPDGKTVAHAELIIGNSIILLCDEMPQHGMLSPASVKGTPVSLLIYVEDADKLYQQAVDAGVKVLKPIADQFHGDRGGFVQDPFGHQWEIMSHIEDVSPEEMKKRMSAQSAKMAEKN